MLVLISTGWGPRCLSAAGTALIQEVYRVETFGLDPDTRAMLSQLHTLCNHAPLQDDWQNDDLLAAAARALRLAQTDERAAFVTPSGPLSEALWPIMQQAAVQLGIPVRFAHGLGLAESMAACLQLTLPPITEIRPTLADFVGETRMPALAVAATVGDVTQLHTLYDGEVRIFTLDLYARNVQRVDLAAIPAAATNILFVAAKQHINAVGADHASDDISDTVSTTADWVELFNNMTEVISD